MGSYAATEIVVMRDIEQVAKFLLDVCRSLKPQEPTPPCYLANGKWVMEYGGKLYTWPSFGNGKD